jgi:ABC-type multidrug transport system fused ATPase/permease subunit
MPFWRGDDFSVCFRAEYLTAIIPLALCGISFVYLAYQLYSSLRTGKRHHGYQLFLQEANGHVPTAFDSDSESDSEESDEERFLSLRRPSTHESIIQTDRPKGIVLLVAVEELAVLSQLAVHIVQFVYGGDEAHVRFAQVAQLVVWGYITVITSIRLLLSGDFLIHWDFSRLWYHTAFLYSTIWIMDTLLFRSSVIQPGSRMDFILDSASFALTSLLAIIALTSRKGNREVKLEIEENLTPSKEQIASLVSLASFGWVDGLIWKGYKNTLEITDVWNIPARDQAANLLASYRQLKRTSSLAFHLLKFFNRGLLIQAAWAVMSGFLTFAPTMLLKAILEYIEKPASVPRNAAWFYVILLFVSGVISAVADGQALWIGRKLCLRLRAIIIGEIYTKTLKRKVTVNTEKVLGGEGEDNKKKSAALWKRALTCFCITEEDTEEDTEGEEPDEQGQVASGTIINLMAVDSFKVSEICAYLHFLWASTPIQFIGTIYLLYTVLGYSSFVGVLMMFLLFPLNMIIANEFARLQKDILAATDARIHITNEILGNIRIIKFFAWEQRFLDLVDEKRELELKKLKWRYLVWALAATLWTGAPILITFLSFMVYTRVEQKDLIPSIAFTALSLFMILRIPLDQLADMMAHVQESKVSVDRVEEYLNEPETDKFNQLGQTRYDENGQPIIGFEDAIFSWGSKTRPDPNIFQLLDIDCKFQVDRFNVIVGPTGSGKTSMLMALLGEMTLIKGSVALPSGRSREDLRVNQETGLVDSVAYCAQQAWLINADIKDNIVFASPWDSRRYKDVIKACALERDLEILDDGDQTLVGEKGVTLSGGQKQRISLARALYSRARHILLDDVLSAVDAHTAKWIFEEALLGPLMHNRTCILVTHSVSLCLPHADFAVVMDNGRVAVQGSSNDVIQSGKLAEHLAQSGHTSRNASRVPSETVPGDTGGSLQTALTKTITTGTIDEEGGPKNGPKKSQEETKQQGSVKMATMFMYFAAMGSWIYWTTAAFVFVAQQLISILTNVWLREWANAYARKTTSESSLISISSTSTFSAFGFVNRFAGHQTGWTTQYSSGIDDMEIFEDVKEVDDLYYLSVYAAIGIMMMFAAFLREYVLFWGSINASRRIHTRLLERIMRAKFRFFDSTPLGQIMNRFSKDIENIDQEITPTAVGFIYCVMSVISIVVLISVILPAFLFAGFFITILYFLIGMFYINSSRDLKRMESVTRSPLYQQFGETLSGTITIRAYGDERRFIRENLAQINIQNRPFIFLWAANRWLAFRVDIVGSLVSFVTGMFVVLSVGKIDPGAAGLALTYAITFTENVLWLVRLYSANEQNMNSVERIKEYLDVEQEAAAVVQENRPQPDWPASGAVEFINYSTRYRQDFDVVLKNLSFKVEPKEKIGVVGRTGAGKSSMALALFRALEAEEGRIVVDDVDIGLIGLEDLRKQIMMVPQDPTLFSGTIRTNLDPFERYTDDEMFEALRRVQLIGSSPTGTNTPEEQPPANGSTQRDSVTSTSTNDGVGIGTSSTPTIVVEGQSINHKKGENRNVFVDLESPIAESGTNLSQGQRQLLCLARALLQKPTVLIMDEATASIDHATDSKIQDTIRKLNNTTITIAHRLKTIVDYDKVLVLDRGEVMEYGPPWELLDKEEGMFKSMCETSGEMELLREMAKSAKASHDRP